MGTTTETAYQEWRTELTISEPCELRIQSRFMNKSYPEKIIKRFDPHLAFGAKTSLTIPPSPYYTAGGDSALTDGVIGTDNFRDGCWQAIQGKDMEVIVDLGVEKEISSISTNWFYYGNAWIFRPSSVKYLVSSDNIKFAELKPITATLDEKAEGELITEMPFIFEKKAVRYIKMIAVNNGPCPTWHDAAGEPSWLFCDEIRVR